jgi:hypothetical protein
MAASLRSSDGVTLEVPSKIVQACGTLRDWAASTSDAATAAFQVPVASQQVLRLFLEVALEGHASSLAQSLACEELAALLHVSEFLDARELSAALARLLVAPMFVPSSPESFNLQTLTGSPHILTDLWRDTTAASRAREVREQARLLMEAASLRERLQASDDLSDTEKLAALREPLLTPPPTETAETPTCEEALPSTIGRQTSFGSRIAAHLSEDSLDAALSMLDARSLRTLKAVSSAWRLRARRVLGDPRSRWRHAPRWSEDDARLFWSEDDARLPACGDSSEAALREARRAATKRAQARACEWAERLRPLDAAAAHYCSQFRGIRDADEGKYQRSLLEAQLGGAGQAEAHAEAATTEELYERPFRVYEALHIFGGLPGLEELSTDPEVHLFGPFRHSNAYYGNLHSDPGLLWCVGLDPVCALPSLAPKIVQVMLDTAAEIPAKGTAGGAEPQQRQRKLRTSILLAARRVLLKLEPPTLAVLAAPLWRALADARHECEDGRVLLGREALRLLQQLDAVAIHPHAPALLRVLQALPVAKVTKELPVCKGDGSMALVTHNVIQALRRLWSLPSEGRAEAGDEEHAEWDASSSATFAGGVSADESSSTAATGTGAAKASAADGQHRGPEWMPNLEHRPGVQAQRTTRWRLWSASPATRRMWNAFVGASSLIASSVSCESMGSLRWRLHSSRSSATRT